MGQRVAVRWSASSPRLRLVPGPAHHAVWNTFIEGDNLEVLRTLAPGIVDLIYTDPPYNTGNDFAYADSLPRRSPATVPAGTRRGRR